MVLCGHSYGGAVITEAAYGPHPAVRELVYLTAAAPGSGQITIDVMGASASAASEDDQGEDVVFRDNGLAHLTLDVARAALFNDCDERRAQDGLDRLVPANLAGSGHPFSEAAWTQLPFVYVRGTEDRMPEALAPGFLERSTEIIELPTGHCPSWSRPDLVADLLVARVHAVTSTHS